MNSESPRYTYRRGPSEASVCVSNEKWRFCRTRHFLRIFPLYANPIGAKRCYRYYCGNRNYSTGTAEAPLLQFHMFQTNVPTLLRDPPCRFLAGRKSHPCNILDYPSKAVGARHQGYRKAKVLRGLFLRRPGATRETGYPFFSVQVSGVRVCRFSDIPGHSMSCYIRRTVMP